MMREQWWIAAGLTITALVVVRSKCRRIRRAVIEVNLGVARMLVADVQNGRIIREVFRRQVASGDGVVDSLKAEARDVGAEQEVVIEPSVDDQVRGLWTTAKSRGASEQLVVGCVRQHRSWSLAAVAEGRTYVTGLIDDKLEPTPPEWLKGIHAAALVGDDPLASVLNADDIVTRSDLLAIQARHSIWADAAAQIDLLLALAHSSDLTQFRFLRSLGLCAAALVTNNLFL